METQLYVVHTTRVVLAASPAHAKNLALAADNPDDVDAVDLVEGLWDVPGAWYHALPYGATDERDVLRHLAAQLAADPRFDAFEYHPCLKASEDELGAACLEQCDDNDPEASVWSVYGHLVDGGLECVADFGFKIEAVEFLGLIQKALPEESHV
jgi:hypothetical protein